MFKKFILKSIHLYRQYISPMSPPKCIYVPTCSQYAIEAIEKYGTVKGGFLATKRIFRCHPLRKGGIDPLK